MSTPVIYINCHDAGRLIQPYGHPVSTPNLQRFAEESVFFRNAHSVAPTCSPSRAALATGGYPHQVGMLGLAHRGFALNNYSEHLAGRLAGQGYYRVLCGYEHVGAMERNDVEKLYNVHLKGEPEDSRPLSYGDKDRMVATKAARVIEERADLERPFYLECAFFYPHRPFPNVEPDSMVGEPPPPFYLPDTERTREDMRAYAEAMRQSDECFGIVLDALRKTGLDRRAIIIVTTDHGPAFPWAKCNLNDQGTGVMLMMRLPEVADPVQVDALVSQLDILPTIYDVLGLPQDERFEGVSLRPLINGETDKLHDEVFSEVTYHAAYEPMRSVRTNRYRYVKRFATDWDHPVMPNIDEGPSREELLSAGIRDMRVEMEALYDLDFDPGERRNLIDDTLYEPVAVDLKLRLRQWMERTDDPLLLGDVALPEGAITSPHDGLHI